MAQRYLTRFDSFEGLETVVQAIEGFSQERFLASLHLNNRRKAMDIAALDTKLLGTHRTAATTNPNCNRLFLRKKVERSTPVTTNETRQRNRFGAIAAAVAARAKDLSKMSADQAAFAAQKDQPNGKKTMLSFLWKLEKEAYDAEHNG